MAVVCSDNTEELLGEYNEVLNSLSDDSMTEMYLLGQKEVNPEELIRPMQAGRDGRICIHVIRLEDMSVYPEGQETTRKGQILRSTSNTAPLTCGACNTQPEGLLTTA